MKRAVRNILKYNIPTSYAKPNISKILTGAIQKRKGSIWHDFQDILLNEKSGVQMTCCVPSFARRIRGRIYVYLLIFPKKNSGRLK